MRSKIVLLGLAAFFVFIMCQSSFAGKKVRYQFERGKTYKYSTTVNAKTSGQMMGQEFTMTSGANLDFSLTPIDSKSGVNTLTVTFDKFEIKLDMPMMGFHDSTIVMSEYAGKRMKVMMTDFGKSLSVEPIDTIPPSRLVMMASLNPADLFKQLFFELPDKELDVNSTWKKDVPDTTTRGAMKMITKQNVEFKVAGTEKMNNFKCWKIDIKGSSVLEGSGSQRGNDVTIDGTVKVSGTAYVAPAEGVFVSSEQTMENDMTTTVTGSQTGASTMTITSTVKTVLVK